MKLLSLIVLSAAVLSAVPAFASERPNTHPTTSIIIVGGRPATKTDAAIRPEVETSGRISVEQLLALNPQPLPPQQTIERPTTGH